MSIVPKHKSDIETGELLLSASDSEVLPALTELLEWLQDINWPVAPYIIERLSKIELPLVEPLTQVLNGEDEIWKYWIISGLLSEVSLTVRENVRDIVTRIADNPTPMEVEDEVNMAAKELLDFWHTNAQ